MIEMAKEILAYIDAELVSRGKIPQITYIFRQRTSSGCPIRQRLSLPQTIRLNPICQVMSFVSGTSLTHLTIWMTK